jgi:sigma-B regulation protein RsbU (phosphoserine phosphatase)
LRELVRSLLPQPLPDIPGVEVAASCRPCGPAGGDSYDFFPLDDAALPGRWCIFVGDASGHGLAAAVVMSMVQSILHAHPPRINGPADLLAHVNRHLCRKRIRGFVTAFLGIYDPRSRQVTYSCAGHPPPLLRDSADGSVSRLDAVAGCPLGIEPSELFEEATVYIRRRDTILFYTDGITEARDVNDDMFSEERLRLALEERGYSAADLIERLESSVGEYRRGRSATDDETLVAVAGI